MSRALQAELIKLRTTRTFAALVAAAAGLSLVVVVLIASVDTQFDEDDLRTLFTIDQSGLFILLLGAIGMAGEWRHQTIASTVLATPHRLRLIGAKVLAYGVAGAVLSLIVTVAIMAVGSAILAGRGEDTLPLADLIDVGWRNLTVAALFGGYGVCVGALVRNPAGAIVLLLALSFVLEPTLWALAPDVGKFGPLAAAPAGLTETGTGDDFDVLASGVAVLVMLGWLALLYAAAVATFKQRDLV